MITQSMQGAVHVFRVDSALNAELGEELVERAAELPRVGRTLLVVDMATCPLVNSAGCEALLDLRDAMAHRNGVAHLAGLTPLCGDVLLATGVRESFAVFPGVREAVLNLAQ